MKVYHHHKYKFFAGEDCCRCGDSKIHKHKWRIYYQRTVCFSNHNYEECKCGKLRDYWQLGDGPKELMSKTPKETSKLLKEKVKQWMKA